MRLIQISLITLLLVGIIAPVQARQESLPLTFLGNGLALTSLQSVTDEEAFINANGDIPLYAQLWAYDADGVLDRGEEILDDWVCPAENGAILSATQTSDCTPYSSYPTDQIIYANRDLDLALVRTTIDAEITPLDDLDVINALYAANEEIASSDLAAVLDQANVPAAVDGSETSGDTYAPELGNGGIDVLHYHLDLRVDMQQPPLLEGIATLQIKAIQPNLASFTLDLRQMQVNAAEIDGVPAEFQQGSRKVRFFLEEPLDYGAEIEVVIHYNGVIKPIRTPYLPFFPIGAIVDTQTPRFGFASEPDTADTWFPCNNHPLDAATYEFYVTVPPEFEAVANGQPLEIVDTPEKQHTFGWEMPFPMATYLATIAVADYETIEDTAPNGIPLRHYVYAGSNLDLMRVLFSGTGMAMQTLEGLFGAYPFASYGHVIIPLVSSALETQTMTLMPFTMNAEAGEESIWSLVVHEMAHQWFGDSIRLGNWKDIWLNEGFATLAEWLADEARYGEQEGFGWREYAENAVVDSNRETPLAFPEQEEMFSADSYQKGAWILHMLRVEFGDEVFLPLLRAYYVAFAGDTVTTNAFFQFVERYTGRDLTQFRQQWMEQAGIPEFTLYWTSSPNILNLRLCSTRPDQAYTLDLPLRFSDSSGNEHLTTLNINPDSTQLDTAIPINFTPETLTVDPFQIVLEDITVSKVETLPECE